MDELLECVLWLVLGVIFSILLIYGWSQHWNWILLFVFLEATVICFAKLWSIVEPSFKMEDDDPEADW